MATKPNDYLVTDKLSNTRNNPGILTTIPRNKVGIFTSI